MVPYVVYSRCDLQNETFAHYIKDRIFYMNMDMWQHLGFIRADFFRYFSRA